MGIGGIGMSSLAAIVQHQNFTVSGCDSKIMQPTITRLQDQGCSIHQHGAPECFCDDITTVVYSTAIPKNHPELVHAHSRGIQILHRAQLLAQLMAKCANSIAVSGSHGKTTTTSLIAHCLAQLGYDPTVVVGGMVPSLNNSNARVGKSSVFVLSLIHI